MFSRRSPDGSTGVPACTIAVAVSAELSAICPALDDALAPLDEPGVTVVDRAMPSGEALALDECTCLCMLMQPPSPKALWHAASALLPRTADRYSTCILVVQAASAAALSDQDPAIPGIQVTGAASAIARGASASTSHPTTCAPAAAGHAWLVGL